MNRQRKINYNLGKDTHVRNHVGNKFNTPSSQTYQMIMGEIKYPEPEPLFKQNMVTVGLARGGDISGVAYPGAFLDPLTGYLHGTYEGPIPGQMVMVGFENGNSHSPFVVNRYPYQGKGDTLNETAYFNPLTTNFYDATDVMIGHFTGSYLTFNTGLLSGNLPGSISISAQTDFDVEANTGILLESLITAELKGTITTITGSTYVALNGTTNFAVKYTELKTAFDLLKSELNTFIANYNSHQHPTAAVGLPSPPTVLGIPAVADMSASQNLKVLM